MSSKEREFPGTSSESQQAQGFQCAALFPGVPLASSRVFPHHGHVATGEELRRVGRAVAARRGELGMTQQELADAAGVDIKTVYNLESGTRWPIARTRAAISAALGWQADALDSGAVVTTAPPAPGLPRMSPEQEKAARPHLGPINRRIGEVALSTGTPLDQLTGAMLFDSLADQLNWDQLRGFGYPPAVAAVFLAILKGDEDARDRNHQGSAAGLPAPSHVAVTIRA